jgi:hypothetical protein
MQNARERDQARMNYQRFGSQYVLRLDPGDEVVEPLQ